MVQTVYIPDGTPQATAGVIAVIAMLIGLMMVGSLPPVRRWLGTGQHTPQPDERDSLIEAHSQAATLVLLREWILPIMMIAAIVTVYDDNKLIVDALVVLWAMALWGPTAFSRWYFNTRM